MTDPSARNPRPFGVLIVDRSSSSRRHIASLFAGRSDVQVVGESGDGEGALALCAKLKPDLITLDLMEAPPVDANGEVDVAALESPRVPMDGLTFLGALMSTAPAPVILITRHTERANVFRALQLGALDVIPIPAGGDLDPLGPQATEVRTEILKKVLLVRSMRDTHRREAPPGQPRPTDKATPDPRTASILEYLAKLEPDEQATLLLKAAVELHQAGNIPGARLNYTRILERFPRAEKGIQGLAVAMATYNMGLIFGLEGQQDVELRCYDALVSRFGDSSEPEIRHKVAMALFNKAVRLRDGGDLKAAIRVHDEFLARFGDEPEASVREQTAAALLDRAEIHSRLNRTREELRDYEELIARFGSETALIFRQRVAAALGNRGAILATRGLAREAIRVFEDLAARFGSDADPLIRQVVALASDNCRRARARAPSSGGHGPERSSGPGDPKN